MKTNYLKLFIALILFSSCEKKVDLATEVFNKSTYKATIEKAYADSTNKADQEILLSFIDNNLEGKIAVFAKEAGIVDQVFDLKKDFDSPNPPSELTYKNILDKYARPYSIWLNKTKDFNNKVANSLDLKALNLKDEGATVQFQIQNKGASDIVTIKFNLAFDNKSGEELEYLNMELNEKIIHGANIKYDYMMLSSIKVANMDFNALKQRIIINEISFQDGSTLIRPEQIL